MSSDIATHAHTNGGPGWPEIRGTSIPVGEQVDDESHLAREHALPRHDYTWGASRAKWRLGPILDEPETFPETRKPRSDKGKPQRKRTPAARPEESRPPYMAVEPVIPAYVVTRERRNRSAVAVCVRRDTVSERPIRRDYSVATMLDDLIGSEPVSIYRFPETG